MYIVEHCENPEDNGTWKQGEDVFTTDDNKKIEEYSSLFDKYVYLPIIMKIIKSCSEDVLLVPQDKKREYWEINKFVLNYLNAVYFFRNSLETFYDNNKEQMFQELYSISRKEKSKDWFRFICEYRNRMIHQVKVIQDYSPVTGAALINLDSYIISQTNIINKIKKDISKLNKKKDSLVQETDINKIESDLDKLNKKKENAQWFRNRLFELAQKPDGSFENQRLKNISPIITMANEEIFVIAEEMLTQIYRKKIEPAMKWMLGKIHKENDTFMYTVIRNSDDPEDIHEPIYYLTTMFALLLKELGRDHSICKKMYVFFTSNKVDYFYNDTVKPGVRCTIDDYITLYCE